MHHRKALPRPCHTAHRPLVPRCPAAVLLALGWLAMMACAPEAPIPRRPHPIIIVDVDTLRADHLGVYGYHRDTSPNIDAFAVESLVFENAFSQAPNTPPSQTSILTGLYPSSHGMVNDDDRVPMEVTTLAEALSAHGYTTAGFHDGGYMKDVFQIGQGFDLYVDNRGKGLKWVGPKSLAWIRAHAEENFLLFIHTYDPHTPYAPPAPYDSWFMEGIPAPTDGFEPTTRQMNAIRLSAFTDSPLTLPPNDLAYAIAQYDGEIRYVDQWFGAFWEVVCELGLDRRATVVFISDHGEEFQEHGSVLHEKLYATVTRIPFMIRLPGGVAARSIPEVVESVDLMPTLLELAGAPAPDEVQGSSLVPLMLGRDSAAARTAHSESPWFGHRRAVTLGRHRMLLTRDSGEMELYDLETDPLEQDDIAADNPAVLEVMRSFFDSWQIMVDNQPPPRSAPDAPLDEETLRQLQELGYIR